MRHAQLAGRAAHDLLRSLVRRCQLLLLLLFDHEIKITSASQLYRRIYDRIIGLETTETHCRGPGTMQAAQRLSCASFRASSWHISMSPHLRVAGRLGVGGEQLGSVVAALHADGPRG